MREQQEIRFYKLNKSKRYGVEGTYFRFGELILACVFLTIFLTITVAFTVVNFDNLFRDVRSTIFIIMFVAILALIFLLIYSRYIPVHKRRKAARKILKNCTLTDGTVIDIQEQRVEHSGTDSVHYRVYYRVLLTYKFYGTDGAERYGELRGNYGEIPFFVGQNLMIAFNDTNSVIMNKFTLTDGAEEFAAAEAEREKVDFQGLTGYLFKVDTTKTVAIAEYSWSVFGKIRKRKKRLKQILSDNPRFTVGRYFIKKSTYRSDSGNTMFYCFKTSGGAERIGECGGIEDFKDGKDVMVAYSGDLSEIISYYTVKPKLPKPRRKKLHNENIK